MVWIPMLVGLVLGGLAVQRSGADEHQQEKQTCCNPIAIRWVYPGDFREAQKKAAETNRILLIKGLGFGLDEVGATDATKGCW